MGVTGNSISPSEPPQKNLPTEIRQGADYYASAVPAVDQASRLLFALAEAVRGEGSLTELAKQTGIGKSKALAVLNTLCNAGLVTRDEYTKNYALGAKIHHLHRAMVNNTDLARAVTPYLQKLAAETACSVHFGVVAGETLFVVAQRYPPGGTYIPLDAGHRLPLLWGAHGRAYLAALPVEEAEQRLTYDPAVQTAAVANEGIDRETLRLQVDECRRLGYGKTVGMAWWGRNAVSAVLSIEVPNHPGVRWVPGCLVAIGSFPPDGIHRIGCLLMDAATEMSERLGPLLQAVNINFPLSKSL